MKKIILLGFVFLSFLACQEKKEASTTLVSTEQNTETKIDSQLENTLETQEALKADIIALSKKKDSLSNLMKNTKESMARINDSKIDKGIEGVNKKLNELKGQKENIDELSSLQKKEITLAEKKVDLLNQEKVVYDEQKKALWSKGAPPKDFVQVDSLLGGINSKINDQNKRVKSLKRNVADMEEQIVSIEGQRNFLSTKIRENYNAQDIFTEFAKDEESKISLQIGLIDAEITKLSGNVGDINSTVANLNSEKSSQEDLATANQMAEEESEKTKNRLLMALIVVGLLTLLFGVLFYVGKRNKNKKNK